METRIIPSVIDHEIEWLSGEETDQIHIQYDISFQKPSPFENIRLITTSPITPKIVKDLESGSPYGKTGTPDDVNYSQTISMSITENFCDKFAAPHFIHNFETQTLPNPFPEETAVPLSLDTTTENELLDDPEFIGNK